MSPRWTLIIPQPADRLTFRRPCIDTHPDDFVAFPVRTLMEFDMVAPAARAPEWNDKDKAKIRKLFDQCDADKGGTVSLDELGRALALEREASGAFVAAEAAKTGAKTTESGLVYSEITAGEGASPGATDKVRVHYHGTLRDGSVFDSSVDRGEPAEFGLSQVISGWTEALQLMKVGDKWRLFLPPTLAYGEQSPTPAIPPNSALIFEVELLEIR